MNINIKGLTLSQIEYLRVQLTEYKKSLPIQKRIKTFDDVLSYLGIEVNEFNDSAYNLTKDEIAYKKLKFIVQALNEGWQPDWNSNECKYYPWFKMVGSGAGFSFIGCVYDYSSQSVGSRLVFKSRELAEYAGQQFIDLYRDMMLFHHNN
ncbi:hypothetical protein D3C71_344450 [compost metagenome]